MWGEIAGAVIGGLGSAAQSNAAADAAAPTAEQKQALSQATDQHNYHVNTYRPLEQSFIEQANSLGDASHVARLMRRTNADSQGSLGMGLGSLNATGVDPSSGKYQTGAGDVINNALTTNAGAMANAPVMARENQTNALLNAVKMGNGINGAAMQGMNTAASLSTDSASQKAMSLADMWNGASATGRGLTDLSTYQNAKAAGQGGYATNADAWL